MTKINSSSQPQALATPQTTAPSAPAAPVSAKAAPMIGPEPPPPRDPFANDAFGQCGPSAADLFMKQAAPSAAAPHPKLASASMPAMTAGQLAQQSAVSAPEASRPKADPDTQKLLNTMTTALAKPDVFDANTFGASSMFGTSKAGLGTQLNVSVFDQYSNPEALTQGLKGLLQAPEQTKAAFSAALSHLPPEQRDAAADAILSRMGDKLCGLLQGEMVSQVRDQLSVAQVALKPMCGEYSPMRLRSLAGLASATPPLSTTQISDRLQSVGVPPSDARSIARDIVSVRKEPDLMAQLSAGAKGDLSGPGWERGMVMDGTLRNLDEKLQGAFEKMSKSVDQLDDKLSNDQVSGDALFTNDLFKIAKESVLSQHKIAPRETGGTALDKLVYEHIDTRKTHERIDSAVSGAVLALSSLALPGLGAVAAGGFAAASSAPGVLVAQSEMNAAHAGAFAGSNSSATAATYEGKRDDAVKLAVAGALLSGLRYSDEAVATFKDVAKIVAETGATEAVTQGVTTFIGSTY